MSVNYTPTFENYTGQGKFRFWCQTVLPLVYDDALSYMELLNKMVIYLNNTIQDVAAMEDNVDALLTAYNQLQEYVNDYFDNLDVQQEINHKLDSLVEDGTMDRLIEPFITAQVPGIVEHNLPSVVENQIGGVVANQIGGVVQEQIPGVVAEQIPNQVTTWLQTYVDPVGSAVVVDSSLSITGAAADAKVVGDELDDVKSAFYDVVIIPTNYGESNASDVVAGASALVGHITASNASNGGIDIVNSSGVNGDVGIALTELEYDTSAEYVLTVEFTNLVYAQDIRIKKGMANGTNGTVLKNFTQDSQNPNRYTITLEMSTYDHTTNGDIFVSFNLRSSQTTPVNIKITAYNTEDYSYINLDYLHNIGMNNFTSEVIGEFDKLADIVKEYHPTNYGEISASEIVIGSSSLTSVTATDNANGGVDVVNGSGVNGQIGFPLSDLAYNTNVKYDITLKFTNLYYADSIQLRRGMSSGNAGTVVDIFVQDQTDPSLWKFTANLATYNYTSYGDLYVSFNLRSGQTTAVNVVCKAVIHGETDYNYVDLNLLHNISTDNLSKTLADNIAIVSGDTPTTYGGKQICTFNKGIAIGDSLTAGVFNHNEGGTTQWETDATFSYPAKLEQMTGVDMTNISNGGYTSAQWYTAHASDDLSGYQFAIIQLGVNDAIENGGWTEESETAFTNIIQKLQNENEGIFVFVSTIIPATSYTGASYTAVSKGIRDLVENLADDHVILLDMAQYGNTAKETGYNNGHLSAIGYQRLAQDYLSYISYVISQDYTLFRNIQFIGTSYSYS